MDGTMDDTMDGTMYDTTAGLRTPVDFYVPTGAFGNALGGFIAKQCMAPTAAKAAPAGSALSSVPEQVRADIAENASPSKRSAAVPSQNPAF